MVDPLDYREPGRAPVKWERRNRPKSEFKDILRKRRKRFLAASALRRFGGDLRKNPKIPTPTWDLYGGLLITAKPVKKPN